MRTNRLFDGGTSVSFDATGTRVVGCERPILPPSADISDMASQGCFTAWISAAEGMSEPGSGFCWSLRTSVEEYFESFLVHASGPVDCRFIERKGLRPPYKFSLLAKGQ